MPEQVTWRGHLVEPSSLALPGLEGVNSPRPLRSARRLTECESLLGRLSQTVPPLSMHRSPARSAEEVYRRLDLSLEQLYLSPEQLDLSPEQLIAGRGGW